MNRRWMLPLVLAVAALAFAAGRRSAPAPRDFDPALDLRLDRLAPLLGLTEAQAGELRAIEPDYRAAVSNACDAHCAARCQLAHGLSSDAFDVNEARALVERMCEAHRSNEFATIEYLARLREVLTPEQRDRLLAMVGACLCATCGKGDANCCNTPPHAKGSAP